MSESASTPTKTLSDTATESTEQPLIQDRWTNNITYRQLVLSSCIGILQLWWHPYVHDLRRLLPFLFLYNLFTFLVAYPMFYLELALGVVTKKGVLSCWDLAPSARGIGITMLITSAFTALALSTISAYSLALFVHSFHSFLPWLHCAAAARPACAARHRPLAAGSDTPPQSFLFNLVLNLRRDSLENGLGSIVWELCVYFIISWLLIYFVAIKRVYSYSKLVLFKDALAFFVLVTCAVGALRLDGALRMFTMCEWGTLFEGFTMWREAIEYSLVELSVSTGAIIMLGAHRPEKEKIGATAALAVGVGKASSVLAALLLGAVHGALMTDYDAEANVWRGATSSLVLWADLAARLPGSQFWAALIFFTMFVLSVTSAALMVQTLMSAFTGRSLRKIAWAFLVLACMLFCFVGSFTLCSQGGLHVLNSLLEGPAARPRAAASALAALAVTYMYGQKTFCEEVFFAVGEYPCVMFRVCWAVVPVFLLIMFAATTGAGPPAAAAGWVLSVLALLPILAILLFYLFFKCRVRNIVRDAK